MELYFNVGNEEDTYIFLHKVSSESFDPQITYGVGPSNANYKSLEDPNEEIICRCMYYKDCTKDINLSNLQFIEIFGRLSKSRVEDMCRYIIVYDDTDKRYGIAQYVPGIEIGIDTSDTTKLEYVDIIEVERK
jgi:hypothetical protein